MKCGKFARLYHRRRTPVHIVGNCLTNRMSTFGSGKLGKGCQAAHLPFGVTNLKFALLCLQRNEPERTLQLVYSCFQGSNVRNQVGLPP
jgi:hypothetical protein